MQSTTNQPKKSQKNKPTKTKQLKELKVYSTAARRPWCRIQPKVELFKKIAKCLKS